MHIKKHVHIDVASGAIYVTGTKHRMWPSVFYIGAYEDCGGIGVLSENKDAWHVRVGNNKKFFWRTVKIPEKWILYRVREFLEGNMDDDGTLKMAKDGSLSEK